MLAVFDFLSTGFSHVPFNHGYLRVLQNAFPESRIAFFGEDDHCRQLASMGGPSSAIEFFSGPLYPRLSSAEELKPWKSGPAAVHCVKQARLLAHKHGSKFSAFLGVTPAIVGAVRRIWAQLNGPLHLVLHGGVAEVSGWRTRNPIYRHFDWTSELGRQTCSTVRFVPLELSIARNLVALFPARAADTLPLEHPISESEIHDQRPTPHAQLNVGFLGDTSPAKGFGSFLDLARQSQGARFHVLGRALGVLPSDASRILTTLPGAPLGRAEYVERLRRLDIVALPLTLPTYEWTASGSLIDCITNLVPVLATKTSVTVDLFRRYGPMGMLVNDPSEMVSALSSIDAEWLRISQPAFSANLSKAREARLPATLAKHYPNVRL